MVVLRKEVLVNQMLLIQRPVLLFVLMPMVALDLIGHCLKQLLPGAGYTNKLILTLELLKQELISIKEFHA